MSIKPVCRKRPGIVTDRERFCAQNVKEEDYFDLKDELFGAGGS